MTLARMLACVDGDTVTRVVLAASGLMVAGHGNRMPKRFYPDELARRSCRT